MSGSLKDLVRSVQDDLPVSLRHERWLLANDDAVYSDEAIEFARRQLARETGGERKGRERRYFRASGMGRCARARIFAFSGEQGKRSIESRKINLFHTGSFIHLKWQMAGLTEGWLTAAEVPFEEPTVPMAGTLDGVLHDGSGFECKSANERSFKRVMTFGPLAEHLLQTTAYMVLAKLTRFSIVYENKADSDWREFRVELDQTWMDLVAEDIKVLTESKATGVLPPMLPNCVDKTGKDYLECPFAQICPTRKTWTP